jgi:hypothetical protein
LPAAAVTATRSAPAVRRSGWRRALAAAAGGPDGGSSSRRTTRRYRERLARIAQLVEHLHGKEGVVGSSPTPGLARARGAPRWVRPRRKDPGGHRGKHSTSRALGRRSTPSSPRPSSARCIRRRRRASPPPQAQRRPRRQLQPALLGASPSRPSNYSRLRRAARDSTSCRHRLLVGTKWRCPPHRGGRAVRRRDTKRSQRRSPPACGRCLALRVRRRTPCR